jgi:PTS system nitrogen regulatory IIA component
MENDRLTIAGWVQPEEILLDVDIRDRRHALEFMAAAIGRAHLLDPAPIARALERREQAASTALGDGFAVPHARIPGLVRPLTLFVRTRAGIPFGAPDGKSVSELLAIVVPADGDRQDHLELLALIARLFSDRAFRSQLATAPDATTAAGYFHAGVWRVRREVNGGQPEASAPNMSSKRALYSKA